jgi:general stress protein 26
VTSLFARIAVLIVVLPCSVAAQTPGTRPTRASIIAAAADVVLKAHYCTFITIGEDGHPQARIVDPLAPDAAFTIWIATNPLTRKVDQIRRNPRVTLSCFDARTSSYVTVLGQGELVSDAAEKQRHWKSDWSQIYPQGARGDDVVLIRLTPARLEIVSESRSMIGDPRTWLPLSIEFPK